MEKKLNLQALLFVTFVLSFNCITISAPVGDMSECLLIDRNFRLPVENENAAKIMIVGTNIRNMQIPNSIAMHDTSIFKAARKYVFENLVPFQVMFPDSDRMVIIKKYLAKRNSEEIINDGFFIGCGDVCTLVGAILIKYGYNCKLVHTVSRNFSETFDVGHVFLVITKNGSRYLYDPTMSNNIIPDFKSKSTYKIMSAIGDLFIFGIEKNPRKLGITDIVSLNEKRKRAYNYWKNKIDDDSR